MLVRGGDDDSGMMAEINVTPLVDVMLVLLIVFMVTAPLLIPQSLGVKLPKTDSVQSPVDRDQMRLLVKPDGSMEMDGKSIGDKELRSMLTAKGADPKFQLQVEADENLKYGRLAEVMAMAQGAGVTRLSFVTVAKNK
jgi:biopolymer transport protein ExbD